MCDAPADTPEPIPPEDSAAARLAVLRELVEIGMVLARAMRVQAEAVIEAGAATTDAVSGVADLGLSFARISRAVRLTLALEARMEAEGTEEARWAARKLEIVRDAKAAGRLEKISTKIGRAHV